MKKSNSQKKNSKGSNNMKSAEAHFFVKDTKGGPIVVRRKLTSVQTDTAATGAVLGYFVMAADVNIAIEWANLSANYEEYRVRAIKARMVPRTRDSTNSAALVWYPGTIVSGAFPSGGIASTIAAIFAEDSSKVSPEWTIAENLATWGTNPNAKLWTPTGIGLPALSNYGVQFLGSTAAVLSYNTVATHDIFVEWDVEFRGRA
jgi:hypothetical protein